METRAEEIKKSAEPKKPAELKKHHFDFLLFIAVLVICAFGLVMVFSASYYYAQVKYGTGAYFLKKQLIFFAAGLASMLLLSHLKFTAWKKLAVPGYIAVCLLLAATLIFGVKLNGARRWINLGFQFQPSEFAKFALVVALSALICSDRININMQSFIQGVLPCLIVLVPFAGLIILQPNFSLVVILCIITYIMLYLGGTRLSHRFLLVAVGLIGGLLALYLAGYRMQRITSYLNPEADPTGANYQIIQSRIALGNGGLFGQGLNFSRQKLLFLPERENDYIFAIIGEEMGFLRSALLIGGYFFVIVRGILIAMRCPDRFGKLLAGGITGVLAVQVLINIGVVTSAIPSTGQTLPFISYGGTSLVVFMSAIGILLNVSRYTEVKEKNVRRTKKTAKQTG